MADAGDIQKDCFYLRWLCKIGHDVTLCNQPVFDLKIQLIRRSVSNLSCKCSKAWLMSLPPKDPLKTRYPTLYELIHMSKGSAFVNPRRETNPS